MNDQYSNSLMSPANTQRPAYTRQVLEYASPLALLIVRLAASSKPKHWCKPKRQRTGALQNAVAPKGCPLPCFAFILAFCLFAAFEAQAQFGPGGGFGGFGGAGAGA